MDTKAFAQQVIQWQRQHGRHTLPWQNTKDPYHIWLSEIMLQQTQVATVIPYYERFLARFPTVADLAAASLDAVMPHWAGLGYYARARNLHRCAQRIVTDYQGSFPTDAATLATLPGIGRTTAAAIAAFAFNEVTSILDGNVKRIFARYFGITQPINRSPTEKLLWHWAEQILEDTRRPVDMAAYTQGLMDLGATVCTRSQPLCSACPLHKNCYAFRSRQQDRLPVRVVARKKPKRRTAALILPAGNKILLQQQPSPGIWGGLWSVPAFDQLDTLTQFVHQQFDQHPIKTHHLNVVQHSFTHLNLTIQPVWVFVETVPQHLPFQPPSKLAWVANTQLSDQALPAPIRRLLLSQELAQLTAKFALADSDECSSTCRTRPQGSATHCPHSS